MDVFKTWPHKWFGFWRASHETAPLPLMEELVDWKWDPVEKTQLLAYLEHAPVAVTSDVASASCAICGASIGNPSCYRSDDLWLWPCDLAHFVGRHGVRLPDRMIQHIASRGYVPPEKLTKPAAKLPWPDLNTHVDRAAGRTEDGRPL